MSFNLNKLWEPPAVNSISVIFQIFCLLTTELQGSPAEKVTFYSIVCSGLKPQLYFTIQDTHHRHNILLRAHIRWTMHTLRVSTRVYQSIYQSLSEYLPESMRVYQNLSECQSESIRVYTSVYRSLSECLSESIRVYQSQSECLLELSEQLSAKSIRVRQSV